jgi:hypothetical protein
VPKPRKPRQLRLNVYRGSGGEPPKLRSGELLLEYFSDHEVLAWRAKSKDVQLGAVPLRLVATADELHNSFMLENWREYPSVVNTPANSQLFGHLLSVAGFEGALFSSTRTGKGNLVLFTRQFKNSASLVRVLNPPTNARCCELSALTYKGLEFGS